MTEEQIDRIGRVADNLDAALYATKLPGLPDKLHVEGLSGAIRSARDEIVAVVKEASKEDPWADNPLEG